MNPDPSHGTVQCEPAQVRPPGKLAILEAKDVSEVVHLASL